MIVLVPWTWGIGSGCSGSDPKTMTGWFLCPQNNSTEKSEERMSCRPTSVEAEKGQGTSGEAEIAKNSAQGTKRKRETKNSTGKRATVPQIVFPWVWKSRKEIFILYSVNPTLWKPSLSLTSWFWALFLLLCCWEIRSSMCSDLSTDGYKFEIPPLKLHFMLSWVKVRVEGQL